MPTDKAFILAAGLGTRMGEIGKKLPKVLWPIFDSSLLGLSISFLRQHGIKEITLNAHHLHEEVTKYCAENKLKTRVLVEEHLLDSGGGVHNYLEKVGRNEKVFIINSDQYIEINNDAFMQMDVALGDDRAVLACMPNPGGFSSLNIQNGKLVEIKPDSDGPMFIGLSLLNPHGLSIKSEPSKFFSSVADYKNETVNVIKFDGTFIDFGSEKNYLKGCFQILSRLIGNPDKLEKWHDEGLIDRDKINHADLSYNCDQQKVLNFSGRSLNHSWPKGSIVISEGERAPSVNKASIIFNETVVTVD